MNVTRLTHATHDFTPAKTEGEQSNHIIISMKFNNGNYNAVSVKVVCLFCLLPYQSIIRDPKLLRIIGCRFFRDGLGIALKISENLIKHGGADYHLFTNVERRLGETHAKLLNVRNNI